MKQQTLFAAILILLAVSVFGQSDSVKSRINFFISVRTKKVDPATNSAQLQAKWQYLFRKGEFYCMFVESSAEMAERVTRVLIENNAMIGNIWFDSHGHFSRRKSLFEIGKDEFNAETIKDKIHTKSLQSLAQYCDENTSVAIGSCYGGATYTLPAIEDFPEQRMNGDTLMIHLGLLLNNATVYGSESFVMTGPGLFYSGYTMAGYPGRKKFRDPIYKPVWEQLGNWNCYNGKTKEFYRVNTVSLTRNGTIYIKGENYLSLANKKEKIMSKISNFKKGNYNIAYLYQ